MQNNHRSKQRVSTGIDKNFAMNPWVSGLIIVGVIAMYNMATRTNKAPLAIPLVKARKAVKKVVARVKKVLTPMTAKLRKEEAKVLAGSHNARVVRDASLELSKVTTVVPPTPPPVKIATVAPVAPVLNRKQRRLEKQAKSASADPAKPGEFNSLAALPSMSEPAVA